MPSASGSCGSMAPGSAACAGAGAGSSHRYTLPISKRFGGSLSRSRLSRTAPSRPGSSMVRITDCSTLIGLEIRTGSRRGSPSGSPSGARASGAMNV